MKPLLKFSAAATVFTMLFLIPFLIELSIKPPRLLEDPEPFHLVSRAHAQDSSISGLDNVSTLQSNYLFIIAIPGIANKNISYGQLTNLLGIGTSNGVTVIQNMYASSSFVLYQTNIYNLVSNLNVLNTFNVSGKATMNVVTMLSATATNGFFLNTNSFAGPTNTVDLATEDQGYASATACSVTGCINRSNNVVETVVMSFTNTASTNWLLTLAGGIRLPQRTNQVAVSNASMATLTLRYHPAFGTNGVFVQF